MILKDRLHVIMGVAGCGKSTIGEALVEATGGRYLEGDAFHPEDNIAKMSRGDALNDDDRWPWLDRVSREMHETDGIIFAGCSALKKSYRQRLSTAPEGMAVEPVCFIHLAGSRELISERMGARKGHFMPLDLLNSQFATLEIPTADEHAVSVDIDRPTDAIVAAILDAIAKQD